MSEEGVSPDRAKVIAAAEAAASWARARRAVWTSEPLPMVEGLPPEARVEPPVIQSPVVPSKARAAVPPARFVEPMGAGPVEPVAAPVRTPAPPRAPEARMPVVIADEETAATTDDASRSPWVIRAAAAALLAAMAAGVIYWRWVASPAADRSTPPPTSAVTPAPSGPATGSLRVTSNPADAEVIVDGKSRGVTPLTLPDLPAGAHAIEVRSGEGSIRRSVTIGAGKTTTIDEAIFAGWVAIYSPFDLSVAEGKRALRMDDSNQIMLPPGLHDLRLTSRSARLRIDAPRGGQAG